MIGKCSICKEKKVIRNISYCDCDIHAIAIGKEPIWDRDLCNDCIRKLLKNGRILEKNKNWELILTSIKH